jgi:hypothetical protein
MYVSIGAACNQQPALNIPFGDGGARGFWVRWLLGAWLLFTRSNSIRPRDEVLPLKYKNFGVSLNI